MATQTTGGAQGAERPPLDASSRTTILVHFYRAMVGRADVWRTRMDTATHWAIGATAAIVSFSLSDVSVPHYVVAIAFLLTVSFLHLEARRLTFYHLFQQRALAVEDALIRPAIASLRESDPKMDRPTTLFDLEENLGRTAPTMSIVKAVARRLRRIYLYLFGVQLLAWCLKLANHPRPVDSFGEFVERAHIGRLPGGLIIAIATSFVVAALVLAFSRGGIDRDTG